MEFILDQQASLAAKTEANTEAIAKLTDAQAALTASVDAMREETRDAINTMLTVAESMSENVRVLTALQIDTRTRLDDLEARIPKGPDGTNGTS
jgi:hypothetical protein